MSKKDKSVLVNVPVKEDSTFRKLLGDCEGSAEDRLRVISNCPQCGAPIYGPLSIAKDEPPVAKYSCNCWRPTTPRPVEQKLMETKEG